MKASTSHPRIQGDDASSRGYLTVFSISISKLPPLSQSSSSSIYLLPLLLPPSSPNSTSSVMAGNKTTLQKAEERLSSIASTLMGTPTPQFPAFNDLPKIPGQPQGCMWGFYDQKGKKDEIGCESLVWKDSLGRLI